MRTPLSKLGSKDITSRYGRKKNRMKILVACEASGIVRDYFIAQGHNAASCDLLPSACPGTHFQRDVLPMLSRPWDMIVAFPPCQHLASSGARWFAIKRIDGRQQQGIDFFMSFVTLTRHVPHVAIENPVGIMSTQYRPPDQIIQPYQYGDPFTKTTCLWLKGLPLLKPTAVVDKGERQVLKSGKSLPAWYSNLQSDSDRASKRSQIFPGIARAMSTQWPVNKSAIQKGF